MQCMYFAIASLCIYAHDVAEQRIIFLKMIICRYYCMAYVYNNIYIIGLRLEGFATFCNK